MSIKRIGSGLAVAGLLAVGCGDDTSSGGERTTAADGTSARSSEPEDTSTLPIARNSEPSERDLVRVRQAKVRAAECVRTAGVRAATDPTAVKSVVIARARGLTLRLTWKSNHGADVYFGANRANVRRTRASLEPSAHVYRKGLALVLDERPIGSAKRELLDRCLQAPQT